MTNKYLEKIAFLDLLGAYNGSKDGDKLGGTLIGGLVGGHAALAADRTFGGKHGSLTGHIADTMAKGSLARNIVIRQALLAVPLYYAGKGGGSAYSYAKGGLKNMWNKKQEHEARLLQEAQEYDNDRYKKL